MTREGKAHGFRLHALRRAGELGTVSAACRKLASSRTLFYRWKKRLMAYGPMACILANVGSPWASASASSRWGYSRPQLCS